MYDAHAGSRNVVLDGPWWLGLAAVVVVSVLVFGSGPWKWLAVPVAAILFWIPSGVRWTLALARSVSAFRDGYRS